MPRKLIALILIAFTGGVGQAADDDLLKCIIHNTGVARSEEIAKKKATTEAAVQALGGADQVDLLNRVHNPNFIQDFLDSLPVKAAEEVRHQENSLKPPSDVYGRPYALPGDAAVIAKDLAAAGPAVLGKTLSGSEVAEQYKPATHLVYGDAPYRRYGSDPKNVTEFAKAFESGGTLDKYVREELGGRKNKELENDYINRYLSSIYSGANADTSAAANARLELAAKFMSSNSPHQLLGQRIAFWELRRARTPAELEAYTIKLFGNGASGEPVIRLAVSQANSGYREPFDIIQNLWNRRQAAVKSFSDRSAEFRACQGALRAYVRLEMKKLAGELKAGKDVSKELQRMADLFGGKQIKPFGQSEYSNDDPESEFRELLRASPAGNPVWALTNPGNSAPAILNRVLDSPRN